MCPAITSPPTPLSVTLELEASNHSSLHSCRTKNSSQPAARQCLGCCSHFANNYRSHPISTSSFLASSPFFPPPIKAVSKFKKQPWCSSINFYIFPVVILKIHFVSWCSVLRSPWQSLLQLEGDNLSFLNPPNKKNIILVVTYPSSQPSAIVSALASPPFKR